MSAGLGGPGLGFHVETSTLGALSLVLREDISTGVLGGSGTVSLPYNIVTVGVRLHFGENLTRHMRPFLDAAGGFACWSGLTAGSWIATVGIGDEISLGGPMEQATPTGFIEFAVSALGVPAGAAASAYAFGQSVPVAVGLGAFVGFHFPN
ncbi:MAG: hypothetical protein ACYCWW_20920 [Deltaproteobacteria bacterium]